MVALLPTQGSSNSGQVSLLQYADSNLITTPYIANASIESYKDQNGLFGLLKFGRSQGSVRSGREGGVRKLGYLPLSILYVKTETN